MKPKRETCITADTCNRLAECESFGETVEVVDRALYEYRLALVEQIAGAIEFGKPELVRRVDVADAIRRFK